MQRHNSKPYIRGIFRSTIAALGRPVKNSRSAILFITETENDEARGYAVETVKAIADPELGAKIQLERQRLESRHQALVTVLENLAHPNGPGEEGARGSA